MKKIFDPAVGHAVADMSQYEVKEVGGIDYFIKPGVSARLTFKSQADMEKYLKSNPDLVKYKEAWVARNIFRIYINFRSLKKGEGDEIQAFLLKQMEEQDGS